LEAQVPSFERGDFPGVRAIESLFVESKVQINNVVDGEPHFTIFLDDDVEKFEEKFFVKFEVVRAIFRMINAFFKFQDAAFDEGIVFGEVAFKDVTSEVDVAGSGFVEMIEESSIGDEGFFS
jgi:hypothetical protein